MMDNGILAGYNIDSMKVCVYDGFMYVVDFKLIVFEFCVKEGFCEVVFKINLVIFELIMKFEIVMLEEFVGFVIGDFNCCCGLLKG